MVDSSGDLEEDESSSVGSSVETSSEDSEEEETDPRVKGEVGSRNDGISIASRYMTRVTTIGLSVCGVLFYL